MLREPTRGSIEFGKSFRQEDLKAKKGNIMINKNIKKNTVFRSLASNSKIRALSRPEGGYVTVANLDARGRSVKTTMRDVQVDSIRRRYVAV